MSTRVICTGISGTGRIDLLREVVRVACERGMDVTLYDVRETMFEIARAVGDPVDEETILDMFPRALVLLRAAALEKIISQIEARPERNWILSTHAVFRWKNTLISGFDPYYLTRLDPSLFVTVTAGVKTTLARLSAQPRWSALTEEDVLTWREEEQFFAEEMGRILRKPQVLLPRRTSVESVFRLLFESHWRTAYLSYPMQHVVEGQERGLDAFKRRLEERLVIFDPADVNDFVREDLPQAERSDGGVHLASVRDEAPNDRLDAPRQSAPGDEGSITHTRRDRLQQHIADQIVVRDYKLIEQSDMVVVFYDVPVPSPGVISEMKYALESGKQVYGVWLPNGEPSVFFTRYCSRWFRGVDALFAHFAEHRVTALLSGEPIRPASTVP